jgi:molybdopterin/thiamine biosynthesis adenylyltransferase
MDGRGERLALDFDGRYSRQVLFAGLGAEGQRRLAEARVGIIGCGALGAAQAALLARAGVGRLRLIDRDVVEFSNLQRQALYDEEDAREHRPKALAAEARLARINSEVAVEAEVADLTAANAGRLLADCDVLLDGTDNLETRYLLNDFAVERGVAWIYGAAVGSRGMTFTILPNVTACLACIFPDAAGAELLDTCDTAGVLGWVVQWVAALQASECVKLIAGARAALRTSLASADLWTNQFRELHAPARDRECRACGRRDFAHLRSEGRGAMTLCGRNAVQIHERRAPLDLAQLAERLRAHGQVRDNAVALRFVPAGGFAAGGAEVSLTVFADGRALIQGTTDLAAARSLYARYVGS